MIAKFVYTVDAAYKTHGYKVQSPIRLTIARNSPDISEYIEKNSVMRLSTSDKRLKTLNIKQSVFLLELGDQP
ncbi:hypothetical protein NQ318_018554 [Aromia moschata]|uniref:Uncharacterized protein n=1 Tax=Aromia moschata TaxID=1265417 RepID=A0AAV8ZGJ1_9CUCU|nr:hypothetical protein NQ318_018554 [Aromia moschata]